MADIPTTVPIAGHLSGDELRSMFVALGRYARECQEREDTGLKEPVLGHLMQMLTLYLHYVMFADQGGADLAIVALLATHSGDYSTGSSACREGRRREVDHGN